MSNDLISHAGLCSRLWILSSVHYAHSGHDRNAGKQLSTLYFKSPALQVRDSFIAQPHATKKKIALGAFIWKEGF